MQELGRLVVQKVGCRLLVAATVAVYVMVMAATVVAVYVMVVTATVVV